MPEQCVDGTRVTSHRLLVQELFCELVDLTMVHVDAIVKAQDRPRIVLSYDARSQTTVNNDREVTALTIVNNDREQRSKTSKVITVAVFGFKVLESRRLMPPISFVL